MNRIVLLLFSFLIILSCAGSPDNESRLPVGPRDNTPCNPDASENTAAVLRYMAFLSEDPFRGVISGQSCGHACNIPFADDLMGFNQQAGKIYNDTGKWPGIIAVDYGYERIFTPEQLSAANDVLIDYWNAGGLVAVGFSPQNPWLNDESDIYGTPGKWQDTCTFQLTDEQKKMIDLDKLIDPNEDIQTVWRRKLNRIASALQELEDAGVTVLFKPMQEQNGFWFWWGVESHPDDPSPYINLYRDMYDYFTYEKGLDNILWLYSPDTHEPDGKIKPQMWLYPGDEYVDIVAPTAYNNSGSIYGYEVFVATGKPLGMAEFGPQYDHRAGRFDNRTYVNRIFGSYSGMAFWISWHDWPNGDGTFTYESIGRNKNAGKLMNDSRVITRDSLQWRE